MLEEIIHKNRSYRRFDESKEIEEQTILRFVDNLRFCPTARNQQVFVYKIVTEKNEREEIFSSLKWAGYLKEWDGPEEVERPKAYVLIAINNERVVSKDKYIEVDLGIVTQTLLLQATENKYGGCIIGAFNKTKIERSFNFPSNIELQLVIALGIPKEQIEIEEIEDGESIKYRREGEKHIVPKRKFKDIIF